MLGIGFTFKISFNSLSKYANNEQILELQVLRERWVQLFPAVRCKPGQLGGKGERFLSAMLSPLQIKDEIFLGIEILLSPDKSQSTLC